MNAFYLGFLPIPLLTLYSQNRQVGYFVLHCVYNIGFHAKVIIWSCLFWNFYSKSPRQGFSYLICHCVMCSVDSCENLLGHFYPTLLLSQSHFNTEILERLEGPLFASETHGVSSDLSAKARCSSPWTQSHSLWPHLVARAPLPGEKDWAKASHDRMLLSKKDKSSDN